MQARWVTLEELEEYQVAETARKVIYKVLDWAVRSPEPKA